MINWLIDNHIEVIGACFALVYLILQIQEKWTTWLACLISSGFYTYIYFDAKLYAEMGLNIYFIAMSGYGLYCWKFIKTKENKPLRVTSIGLKKGVIVGLVALVLFGILSWILIRFTDSHIPYPDALVASLSIVATWMLTRKYIQQWFVWLVSDITSVILCIHQQLYPTAVLFSIYIALLFVGYSQWKKSMIQVT